MNNGNGGPGTVSVINTATNTVVSTITVGISPLGISVTPDGKYVYVANSNINNGDNGPLVGIVSVISTATNTVVGSIPVGTVTLAFGSFISPNIIVAQGGPLLVANDAALTPLGFAQFVNFNGGTIKLTGDWVTSRMISLLAQGGTIDTNGSNAILSGNIINPGSLTKIGAGTLTLTGANSYSGGTNLNGGILAVNSDVNLGAGPLSFDGGTLQALAAGGGITSLKAVNLFPGGGTFLADAGTASRLGGSITGVGSWTKTGPGTLALSGTNTYSGGTTIAGGTLLTQSVSALGTGPVTFGNGTTLQVQNLLNASDNWTVFPGAATVNGGTVEIFGDFNLGGGGTLIANANFKVPGAANINCSGLVVNNQFTIGGDIDLNGSSEAIINGVLTSPIVNVNNVSSLIVNNAGTVAANVNVEPSALLALFSNINGSVTNAGFFQGTGVVNGNVVNSGTVAPGASVGQLTINGNYVQNSSGTLRIEVAGSSPGQYDVLAVNGHASLAGTLQLVRVGGFNLHAGDQITFLTANNGVIILRHAECCFGWPDARHCSR
jgi:autotransporter-associated beta strand protein/YVTN family beta-propeller protein